ncbi:unnamed protein product [Adineta steineri]|uniref:G-protein coupled receptors family 1 profile domain-containing protein n=1 Tax=Adineta steineri TaxID=433720 RepID=A0A814PPA6_9BILA|nr:unnamed protein product [Adineta steineri]CAF1493706.1 unnamed protein product [Adineta steineri]
MASVYTQVSYYAQPLIIIFGTIGALLNQALFYYRKPLRTASCTYYFRALSTNDLCVIWFVIFIQWLDSAFNISPTEDYDWFCKLFTYLNYTFYTISPYYIVLACLDRLCTSSTNVHLRRIATVRVAPFLITGTAIIIFLAYVHVLFNAKLVVIFSTSYCTFSSFSYSRMLSLFLLFFYCVTPPILMIILCFTTFILLRQQRHRIMPVNQTRLRHRDYQLIKMLFLYVTSNMICVVPFSTTYFIQYYYYLNNPSSAIATVFQFFRLLVNVSYGTSFYVYTLGTPFYRDELFKLFKRIRHRLHRHEDSTVDIHRHQVAREAGD